MKIGIIHGFDGGYFHTQYAKKILEEINNLGHEGVDISTNQLNLVDQVSSAYFMPHALKLDYDHLSKKVPIINSYKSQDVAMNKIETSRRLIENNIPTPETVISEDFSDISDLIDEKGAAILKYPFGCAGFGHYIVYRDDNLVAITKEGKQDIEQVEDYLKIGDDTVIPPYYAQEFISFQGNQLSNDRVYRMYVIGNEVLMSTLRIKENDEMAEESIINIAQGAHYEFIRNVDRDMALISLKVADVVGFDIGVIDILVDSEGKHFVIECDSDGRYSAIDRKFRELPDFNDGVNFDKMIAERLIEIGQGKEYRK